MIICRSPLRITLGGGGTDLPSYYLKRSGFLISAAINKYVYVSISRPFHKGIFLKYSKHEHVREINKIKHPIIREVLKLMKIKNIKELKGPLKKEGYLTRDSRKVERKKVGLRKARKKPQFSKR